ncbi:hypothetical protein MtrunA17_Chr8g0339531 [Medicago truncatula]|uniref:Defensin-like protein n=1 Tax=Medicago truncatula TaxID=3880 RepID=A0A072TL33_MEDTR|nr:Defensin-like protein [Medicago truncatula]RHN39034.1 hypothetical protein MtrunA17_Chr8g0339531 [Medicago truncatula]
MTFSASKFYIIFMYLYLAIFINSAKDEEAKICKILLSSTMNHGCEEIKCNEGCINEENANSGECMATGIVVFFCYCFYECEQ